MDGIDTAGIGGASPLRPATPTTTQPAAPVAQPTAVASTAAQAGNLISLLAEAAPPIDSRTVDAIKSLIATGSYPIDPHAIAAKMLALDFPGDGDGGDADA